MPSIKDTPIIDLPREKFIKKGPDALTKSDLLAILLGSGIKGKDVQKLSRQIVIKFGHKLLDVSVHELLEISGIGEAKALQIVSAISLVKRLFEEGREDDRIIKNTKDVLSLTYDLQDKRKEHLVCLYLNARNILIKKEIISVGLLDKSLVHPREIFYPAVELNSASIILVHNHPTGDPKPSEHDIKIIKKLSKAGEIMGIPIIDFIITARNGNYSFYKNLKGYQGATDYVGEGIQTTLFDLLDTDKPIYEISAETISESYAYIPQFKKNYFQIQNRRYIGGKQKLIEWIFSIIEKECEGEIFADIFAGTGIVSAVAAKHFKKIILNDFLYSNYAIYQAYFSKGAWDKNKIDSLIKDYNNIDPDLLEDNYFSSNFGGKYFSLRSAKIIGFIRESIEENKKMLTDKEYFILISSLIYSIDKIANTVGHYDAYFKKDHVDDGFFMKAIDPIYTIDVDIFREDTNLLAKKIKADIVYIDPPYNSRQYSRFYHVLETLAKWDKPKLFGTALKPNPENVSLYCTVKAKDQFAQLVKDLDAKFLVVSYNNTYESKSGSSKNKITLQEIKDILSKQGELKVFEKNHKHFNAGNTKFNNHKEFIFVAKINNGNKN